MKTLACKDMGVECDFVGKADTAEEVVQIVSEHATQAHPDKIAEMSKTMSPDDMTKAMMAQVKDL